MQEKSISSETAMEVEEKTAHNDINRSSRLISARQRLTTMDGSTLSALTTIIKPMSEASPDIESFQYKMEHTAFVFLGYFAERDFVNRVWAIFLSGD